MRGFLARNKYCRSKQNEIEKKMSSHRNKFKNSGR